jgi:hypothetical protein
MEDIGADSDGEFALVDGQGIAENERKAWLFSHDRIPAKGAALVAGGRLSLGTVMK